MSRRKIDTKLIGYKEGEYIDVNGYKMIKVGDSWVHAHRKIWQDENGIIPKGCIIKFEDGNKLNTNIENLILQKRKGFNINPTMTQLKIQLSEANKEIDELKRKIASLELDKKNLEELLIS